MFTEIEKDFASSVYALADEKGICLSSLVFSVGHFLIKETIVAENVQNTGVVLRKQVSQILIKPGE